MPGGLFHAIGTPLADGTWAYTWEKGRQLKRMQSVDTNASFVYNENGLRVQKAVNSVVTNYTLHGKNVVHMTQGSNNLHFFYDAQNKPAIVEYNGTKYAYVRNLQGDIVSILDSTGSVVVYYKYDAWGRPISKTGSMKDTLGALNPFRYRGYVYDEETGLYYLQTRYYKASQSCFLNADCIIGSGYVLTHNAYAYCYNNPVILKDSQGTKPGDVFATEIEAVRDFVAIYGQFEDEYATNIFQLRNGNGYTYGKPVHGKPNTVLPPVPSFVESLKYHYIADCHTHPMVAGAETMASIRLPSTNDLLILCQLDIQHIYIAVPDDGLLKISKSTSEPILSSNSTKEEFYPRFFH